MKTTFDTSKYERMHGKKPRGRGLWAFGAKGEPVVAFVTGPYTEAKRLAQENRPDLRNFVVLP